MSSFPTNVPGPSTISSRPKVNVAYSQFGDGYTQRAARGINNIANVFDLNWSILDESDATTILNYLEGKQGVTKFTWTDPDSSDHIVICRDWSYQRNNQAYSITAKFEQVFDL